MQNNLDECQIFPNNGASDHTDMGVTSVVNAVVINLVDFFLQHHRRISQSSASITEMVHRYRLSWDRVFFMKGAIHGFKRTKRARSIKKRRSKRLVLKTKYRF